jgi:phosphatidylserine decarboxylase
VVRHQYVDRASGSAVDERLFGDRWVRFLYGSAREHAPSLLRLATSARASHLLALLSFDWPLAARLVGQRRFLERCGVRLEECLDDPRSLDTPRKIFERRIRYAEVRPMPVAAHAVVSPADARVVVGALEEASLLRLKGKFFELPELLGHRAGWQRFVGGDFAVLRLTPDKYHYNHTPVAGRVEAIYEVPGTFHSCHPAAVVELATPFSKNRRVVTIFDTDVPSGTGVGRVAMVEVVALMIGGIEQCYSAQGYEPARGVVPGMFVEKGCPKSLYRPGSSTDVLLFEPGRVRFAADLVANRLRTDVESWFSRGFGQPVVETEIAVRALLAEGRR